MTDKRDSAQNFGDDMSEFLQMFLDETEEQLDGLVETMLSLENDSTNREDLNEAFRLIHSIKGSAGMMGFDGITALTHHLESRFERFRSGTEQLDDRTMDIVLRSVDFLRRCNNRLRDGDTLTSPTELLEEMRQLEMEPASEPVKGKRPSSDDRNDDRSDKASEITPPTSPSLSPAPPALPEPMEPVEAIRRMVVRFRVGVQLADLKAQLIVARLSKLGEVHDTHPPLHELDDTEPLEEFWLRVESHETWETLRAAADVDGVESIERVDPAGGSVLQLQGDEARDHASYEPTDDQERTEEPASSPAVKLDPLLGAAPVELMFDSNTSALQPAAETSPTVSPGAAGLSAEKPAAEQPAGGKPAGGNPGVEHLGGEKLAPEKPAGKGGETMRVDIDRLDLLMNLAGELVVNRARFVQISRQINPALRKAGMLNRIRDFREGLRRISENLEEGRNEAGDRAALVQQLQAGMELLDEQAEVWENGRHCFGQMQEAVDQLSRVSRSLQRGVLETRMVPVGPLFSRFRRVVRDLAKERGKKVELLIRGEKTELDKRMIDELADPLVHLVRNSIDHGLESPDVRMALGKPAEGTILLEASHRGNSVYIRVQDDGGGIDVGRIKARLVERQILSEAAAVELSDAEALEYIWHPGFSTAREVTNVSGRGVGMDVVKTRINVLNGTIEIDSVPQRGTSFTLRLPLTLAIINGLLVRLKGAVFSVPIDDVREIVSVKPAEIVALQGKRTFEVRGEFVPLVGIEDVLHWHDIDYGQSGERVTGGSEGKTASMEVVILQAGGKSLGLQVEELLGCQDVVIKSLADNFVNIRGLSGASILGDGRVCLMLDVGTLIDMATRSSRTGDSEDMGP